MKGFTLSNRFSRVYHDHFYTKMLTVSTIRHGVVVAYSTTRSYNGIVASSEEVEINKKKKVVVLGTGWGATHFLRTLNNPSYQVQVISPRNYFAFTPLLPSVTCGIVEATSIVEPIRNIFLKNKLDVIFSEAECLNIDPANKKVLCRSSLNTLIGEAEFAVDYEYLVIAVGAQPNTYGIPGVQENCHFLKEVKDAQKIRRSVINCFENANVPNLSEEERKRFLHFVVVGGGPTGVEFAALLHDFVHDDLAKLYPGVKDLVKITLLEATDHILSTYDKKITTFAEEKLGDDGLNLKTGSTVMRVTDKEISIKEKNGEIGSILYGMAVWATGIGTRPVILDFMKEIGQGNKRFLVTDEWLQVQGCENIYALGDCATINQRIIMENIWALFSEADKDNSGTITVNELQEVTNDIKKLYPEVELYSRNKHLSSIADLLKEAKGDTSKASVEVNIDELKVDFPRNNLPATSQVALQQGVYLAKCFNRMDECERNPEGPLKFRGEGRYRFHPFRYNHLGKFAPLGGEKVAIQLPGDWVTIGRTGQWLWYYTYASKQISWRNSWLVVSDWMRRFVFGRDSSGI